MTTKKNTLFFINLLCLFLVFEFNLEEESYSIHSWEQNHFVYCCFFVLETSLEDFCMKMDTEEGEKAKLTKTFSVPKHITAELAEQNEETEPIAGNQHSGGSGSGVNEKSTAIDKRKQHRFDVIREKLDLLEGQSKDEPAKTWAISDEDSKLVADSRRRDRTAAREVRRDRTPTREERRKNRELNVAGNDGDKTPPRSSKEDLRRGRKRRLEPETNADNESDNLQTEARPVKHKLSKTQDAAVPIIMGIPLTTANLDKLLPPGFNVVPFPSDYKPLNNMPPDITRFQSLVESQTMMLRNSDNALLEKEKFDAKLIYQIPDLKELQYFNEMDMKVFRKLLLLKNKDVSTLPQQEQLEIKCMKLILRVKNGSSISRKPALRNLTDNAKVFGPENIFNIILPFLSDPKLDEQGRHLLIKIIGRVMLKLEDSIEPYTERILIVIMPLLVDENKIARLEGRDVISKLAKAVGLLTLIKCLRPDISNEDDYVRNLVSKTFAVIASSLGIQVLIPFLKPICRSKKSWLVRHTGTKIIQQIAILMGSSILPYLNLLIQCISKNLEDEVLNVRTMTAVTVSSLAEAASPYGYESFEVLIRPLYDGLKTHRGKPLAQFIKGLTNLVPLMDVQNGNFYSFELLKIIRKESTTVDDEMKRAVLITIEKICSLDTIDKKLIFKSNIVEAFFKNFWSRRIALDKKFTNLCIIACHSLSLKVGTVDVMMEILPSLKDESEPYRRMSLEAIDKVLTSLGSFALDDRTVTRLLNGLLFCFQHQSLDNKQSSQIVLNGFANILNNLGVRSKPHIMPIISAVLYRLKNKDSEVREQAADFVSKITNALSVCHEEDLLIRLCTILYESLGEVYPNVLGSMLNALRFVIKSIDSIESLNPPVSQILSTLTPILRNRHEKVQEMTIPLIGDIAIRTKDYISHKEWMRISFELLEMLKAYKKSIRKSANKTFGLIAKVIGPADVLVTLLNNLRVQERQLRVCTAVAIGIVADVCLPFSVLPALMNEYRYPDKNVQNGVLKAIGFMFEYIGDVGSDYIYAITPLLLDALTDRDLVHRQIASNVVKHMALGSFAQGYEDAFINFLDLIWPNVFETSPHVIQQVMESIESLNLVVGSGILLDYVWAGLFHPARKVRESYWKIFNSIYINHTHAMVPYYPRFEEIGPEPGLHVDGDTKSNLCDIGVLEMDLWI